MVLGVVALAVEAKHSQFNSPDSSTSYLSKAIKMKECRADAGHVPPFVARVFDAHIAIEPESRIVVAPLVRPLSCPPRGFRQLRAPPASV
jgi:hypothetical protein